MGNWEIRVNAKRIKDPFDSEPSQSAWILSDTLLHGEIITEKWHAKCAIKHLSQTRGRMTQRIVLHFNRRRCRFVPSAQFNTGLATPPQNFFIGWEGSSQNLSYSVLEENQVKTHNRKSETKTTESQTQTKGEMASLSNSNFSITVKQPEKLNSVISGLQVWQSWVG